MFHPDFKSAIETFAASVQNLQLGLAEALRVQQAAIVHREGQLADFIESKLSPLEQDGKKIYCFCNEDAGDPGRTQLLIGHYRDFFSTRRDLDRIKSLAQDFPRVFFLAVCSVYDAFLTTAFKSALYIRPEFLEQEGDRAGKEITEKGIAPEAARERLMEKALDHGTGEDEADYHASLARKLGISPSDYEPPDRFAEAMARWRLHLYGNGAASETYLELCDRYGFSAESLSAGSQVEITQEYFDEACAAIFETGVKFGHLLWRVVAPQELSKANAALQDLTFGLIQERRYMMAQKLLAFATEKLRSYNDENNRIVFLLNRALASYLAGEKDECRRILSSQDWGGQMDILQLANCVLTEQFQQAAALMHKIGKDNRPGKNEYLRWPLFNHFRERPEFITAFREIFGEVTLRENEVKPFERVAAT